MTHRRRAVTALLALAATTGAAAPAAAQTYDEPFRPQFHFTPAKNWMNDPNGLVFHEGEYHLFFQHNPRGRTWGNISWGHAVSTDLVHWRELPVAIPFRRDEAAWSGSVVVDRENTTGFGTPGNPAMVAIYTAANPRRDFEQSQALAYSLDRGRTWTRYAGNPVLEFAENDFRDPKVFWHAPTRRWVMPVALPLRRKIRFYSSPDLKRWTLESAFGPAGAVEGIYEVPDLFPLEVDGRQRWVLVVNVNPGAPSGGSGAQFFLGDFDGRRFTPEDEEPYRPPAGDVVAGFEGSDLDGWTATGSAFGTRPARGRLPGQAPVEGFRGRGFATSLRGGARRQGTLTSPAFRITRDHLNLLVGGADRPRLPGEDERATVELLVGGRVVRTTTGTGGDWLDWRSWDVRELRGSTARLRVVDHARKGDQAYLSIDAVTQADRAATSSTERARWVDWGRDFYAGITFDGVPDGRRLLVGWMNNWQYAALIPTSPWRSTQSEARELSLERVGGRTELVQQPARELEALREEPGLSVGARGVEGTATVTGPGATGRALDLEATLTRGSAERFGLEVLARGRQATRIGYDATTQRLYVDRRRSGRTAFSPRFASVSSTALRLPRDGSLRLRVLVDHSSVEVFAEGGRRVLTEQVFPGPRSDRVRVFAEGGRAQLRALRIWQMRSIWR
jgi:beta-fructofuranosidase/levanase